MARLHPEGPPSLELMPVAGLANRLRAMASAAAAAAELGRPLVVAWTQQHSICKGAPADLFDLSATPFRIRDDGFGGPPPYPPECLTGVQWAAMVAAASPTRPIRIKSYGQFWMKLPAVWITALRSIRPSPAVAAAVEAAASRIGQPKELIGVHIRRTDNRKAIAESPTELFISEMLRQPSTTEFFLATDDPREAAAILTIVGPTHKVHLAATQLTRDTIEGTQQAFVDLLLLSRCRTIFGCAGSSFAEIAAAYGGSHLRVLTRVA